MRPASVLLLALALAAAAAVACEKSDDIILQEQFQEAAGSGCPNGCAEPKRGCVIKGNVSGQGLKFYILEGDARYPLAIIEPARGEAWFCTVQEAAANGFQPVPPGA